jgi:hypothetical protein
MHLRLAGQGFAISVGLGEGHRERVGLCQQRLPPDQYLLSDLRQLVRAL